MPLPFQAPKRKIPGGLGDRVPQRSYLGAHEKKLQLTHRLPAPFVRHILAEFQHERLCAAAAAQELNLARSRFYQLYSEYLRAYAQGRVESWIPGRSGGDHAADWPAEVTELLKRLL